MLTVLQGSLSIKEAFCKQLEDVHHVDAGRSRMGAKIDSLLNPRSRNRAQPGVIRLRVRSSSPVLFQRHTFWKPRQSAWLGSNSVYHSLVTSRNSFRLL